MEEDFRVKSSVLADLGPLPDVVESDTETTWQAFLQLEAQHSAKFSKTTPSLFEPLPSAQQSRPFGVVSVDDVMTEARRFNRICPVESEWLRLQALLAEYGGSGAPVAAQGAAFARTPPLVKRTAVRHQVEWAAERGCLIELYAFLKALPEDRWLHMGE